MMGFVFRLPGNKMAATCYQDPCSKARCRGHPNAICRIDYCNGFKNKKKVK